jgi:hypothetical protein
MSLAIDVDRVCFVLLSDGWHRADPESFTLDAYEFVEYPSEDSLAGDARLAHGGGESGVCATGFQFRDTDTGKPICGPLTAVSAVMTMGSV